MSISCIMLTHPPKWKYALRAIEMFHKQTLEGCELIIVHRNDKDFDDQLNGLSAGNMKVVRCNPRATLGEMRTVGCGCSTNDLIATWDDDDLHHPDRLKMQYEAITKTSVSQGVSFVSDYVHGNWDTSWHILRKWDMPRRGLRGSIVENSMVYDKTIWGSKWPYLNAGEDTEFISSICAKMGAMSIVYDAPWLFGYQVTDIGVCSQAHHRAIQNSLRDSNRLSVFSGDSLRPEYSGIFDRAGAIYFGREIHTFDKDLKITNLR